MKTDTLRRAILAGVLASSSVLGIAAATPAHAQFGGIVYDPTNYAQNVLTAARTLQQVNQQITQLQNEATMLINQASMAFTHFFRVPPDPAETADLRQRLTS